MILAVILIVFLSISVASTSELADTGDDSVSDYALSVDDDSDSGSSDDVADSADDKKSSDSSKSSSDDSESEDDDSGEFPDCNLTITKEGDKKVKVGDEVVWNITLKNEVDTAWNIHVNEELPKNFEIVSVKASKGEYNKEMSHWEITKLNKGESATLTIKAKAKKEGNYTNKAELFTDSNNLNENTTVKADVEVVKDSKAAIKKSNDKKEKVTKEDKAQDNQAKTNNTKTNATNQTNQKADLKNAGNPIMVLIISLFVVLGLNILRKQ